MDETAKSGVRTRKRNKSIKESAKQVFESIPQIPIHLKEIKKLILKDSPGYSVESCLDEERLLSVLTNGSTGRNPTFFKAFGHADVFGLKAAIPDGCSTLEVVEDVPKLDTAEDSDGPGTLETNVLYVKLPEGHPVITGSEVEQSKPEMSIEEAIEQAEIIFEDNDTEANSTLIEDQTKEVKVDVTPTISVPETSTTKRVSPRLKEVQVNHVDSDAKLAEELSKNDQISAVIGAPIPMHNLRPKRSLRHVQALKQQAKRRKRNTNLASSSPGSSSVTRVSSVTKKSTFHSNGDIEIHYKPKIKEQKNLSELHTMKEVLTSISGFNVSKLRKKFKKSSISATIQMANEGTIDLETPDSILSQVNPRTLLNKSTFLKLPPEYQYKLSLLLPTVDRHQGKLNHSSFNNEFFAKACQEWKERLFRGDFTLENLTKTKADIERDKQKTDPWKVQHFEPVWGIKKGFDQDQKDEIKDEEDQDEVQPIFASSSSSTRSSRMRKIIDDNEDEPLLKKVKGETRASSAQATFEQEELKIEVDDNKEEELPKIDDDDLEEEETIEETVIEEPVNLLEEQDSISEPPLRSCSIDFEEQEVVSIPSPAVATPPMTTSTPIYLPTEPLPATPPITVMACNSPASVRSVRGNSITFSSSRSPSPAASMASLSSAQEDQDEPQPPMPIPIVQDQQQQQPPIIDPSILHTKTVIKPAKTNRTNPTAIINKIRPPIGDVNLERSMEIVRSAVEKSVVNQQQILRAPPMIIRPVHQPSQRPTVQAGQASVVPMTSAPQAVLVTTTDGKTLLAHPASQILRPVGPQASPVRVQRLPVTGAKVTPIVAAPISTHQIQQRPQVQQVCLVQQQPKQPVFRMPTTTSTMVLDSSQINSLINDKGRQIVVKRISPSQSPTPTPVVSTGATRVIQLGNRFIRPQVAPLVRGPTGATTVRVATPTTSNIIVRAAGAGHAAAGTSVVQWPSQPLTSPQLQNLFQRPRAPVHHHHHRIQGPIVRTILVPRQANATLASSSSGTNLSVTTSQPLQSPVQHQLQHSNAVNTPLPNIQLPSEPVPISPQDFERLQQSEEPKKTEENKILFQVQQHQQQQHQSTSKLILIPQPNGQYLAVPASQIQGAATQVGTAKLPPRASSAPPTQEQVWQQTHPARPASVDAMGILRSNNSSQRPSPVATPSTPPVAAATPPMPTLEPNESLSIRASIDSDAERPELTEEVAVTQPSPQNGVHPEVDENEKPEVKVKIIPPTPTPPMGSTTKKVMIKSYGVPLLPKPPSGMGPERGNSTMACNVKALVVCKQCGKFCHNDCISSSNVCVSCLIR